ncbi:aldehyde dehydrogenase family protein [Sporosarcina obsidiansis]|uniref:aldehyde dehydrogenase family protein n=1 Tax=Sporosarcina obsidiansis TaxID=2660748 RepID=UPI00129A6A88|nr:aldehyde dehydrogenase family protein [Sporosarcina obsidiansis]
MLKLKMYIDGKWKESISKKTQDVINPATGEVIAKAASGNAEDARIAIETARKTFDSGIWSEMPNSERASFLFKIADKIEEISEELIRLETLDNGKTFRESGYDVSDAAECFRYYAGLITKMDGQTYSASETIQTIVIHEPVGVCGLIVPWNHPFLMCAWKIAPALAAGNTIVFKPSEMTPITATKLFEIIEEVGIPDGVANLVMGPGREVGNEISTNSLVDQISLIGGTNTGRQIMKAASENITNISLELGGKSPNIIFSDADFETAVDYALYGIYFGSGQVCSAGSRILVEESICQEFTEKFIERAKQIRVGTGDNPDSEMGPLVSHQHMESVLNYIEIGKEEGAHLACGGYRLEENGLDSGYFIAPTVFTHVTPEMRIVREEIFGPVAVIQSFKDEKEAIYLANHTKYGLAGSVFTNDSAKALRVIKKVRAGITYINTYHQGFVQAPWGGYKQSGIGRGLGTFGLQEFQETKQININLQVEPVGWFEN